MKFFTNLLLLLFITFSLSAQTLKPADLVKEQNGVFESHAVFSVDNTRDIKIDETKLSAYTLLDLDLSSLSSLRQSSPTALSLDLPLDDKSSLKLELVQVNIFSDDFTMIEEPSGKIITVDRGTHYRGIIAGKKNSLVALSIYEDEVAGFISDSKLDGNYVLGRMQEKDAKSKKHVLYLDTDMTFERGRMCDTPDEGIGYEPHQLESQSDSRALSDCVRLLLEVDFNMHVTLGSNITASNNYINTLFNGQATLYAGENINTVLSQSIVWTAPSPYAGWTTAQMLTSFQALRNNFNADFANLLTNINFGGLAATINAVCASENLRMCVSGVLNQIANVPTYSFDMEITAHEFGHLFGSFHTHGCYWNGNNTQIDDCGSIVGSPEGAACYNPNNPILPNNGGTIMSYCYVLGNVGVNFANGFGLQPGNVIRNLIANANCLQPCNNSGCAVPQNLAANNVTNNTATLVWGAVNNATSYNVQWRKFAGGPFPWINGASNVNSLAINNLTAFTPYEFRVQTVCNGTTSAWSQPFLFWTLTNQYNCGNDIWENALFYPPMQNNVPTYGLICPQGDVDFQLIQVQIPNSTIMVTLDQLPADYDLELRDVAGTLLAGSYNPGPIPEVINYANAQPGYYYPNIMSNVGAWNPGLYFRLTAVVTPPPPPGAPSNTLGSLEAYTTDLKIYPNPAQDRVTLTFNNLGDKEDLQIDVMNMLGQTVKSIKRTVEVGFNQIDMDISELQNGSYFIRSTSGKLLLDGTQIIIQH